MSLQDAPVVQRIEQGFPKPYTENPKKPIKLYQSMDREFIVTDVPI